MFLLMVASIIHHCAKVWLGEAKGDQFCMAAKFGQEGMEGEPGRGREGQGLELGGDQRT